MFPQLPRPLLFAHRGASRHAPENTLVAFDLGARLGAQVLELDVHQSKDGEIVVCHDARLERTTNGEGWVREHTALELERLDAGYRFRSASGEPIFRGKGVTLPRLREVLEAFPTLGFNIEIKQHRPAIGPAVLALLEAVGPARVLLTAGVDAIMTELEALRPGVPLGLSQGQCARVLRGAWLGGVAESFRGRALQIPPSLYGMPVLSRRLVRRAHAAGLEVHVWTINDPARAARILELGVDGVMTDDPGALAGAFAAGSGLTPGRGGSGNSD